jgi:hypothetical protein
MRKEILEMRDVRFMDGSVVRFSVCREQPAPPPDRLLDFVNIVRRKARTSFDYKGEFLYELTAVTEGYTPEQTLQPSAAVSFEVRSISRISCDQLVQ